MYDIRWDLHSGRKHSFVFIRKEANMSFEVSPTRLCMIFEWVKSRRVNVMHEKEAHFYQPRLRLLSAAIFKLCSFAAWST